MPISVDEVTKVVSVPQSYLTALGGSDYQLDTNQFHLDLREWEKGEAGSWRSITHNHNPTVSVGGITIARVVEIINGYTVTFENASYRVFLSGSNNNILDVTNLNSVSVASTNAAGLIEGGVSETNVTAIRDLLEADEEYTATTAKKFHRVSKTLLLDKNVSGGTPPASTITIDE